jgi:AraC family transcriptional regulator
MLTTLTAHGHAMRPITPHKGEASLFCMASGAGLEMRVNEVYSWDGLQRGNTPFVLIQHTISGEGRLDFAGTPHRVMPGETMLLTFPHAHRYWLDRGKAWEYFWLTLNGREALRLAGAILAAQGPILRPSEEGIDRMADACHALLSGDAQRPGAVSCAAYQAITALFDDCFSDASQGPVLPAAFGRVRAHVKAHLDTPLDVSSLARVAGLSRAHFVRQFALTVGEPPSDYVFRKRIERAMRMLLATDMPIKTIAQACGFEDANYFGKAFRRAKKISPGNFRLKGRTEPS